MSDSVQHTSAYPATRGSSTNVTCDNCIKPYERWNLKDHTERDHPGIKQVDILFSNQTTLKFPNTNLKGIQPVRNNNKDVHSSILEDRSNNTDTSETKYEPIINDVLLEEVKLFIYMIQ